MSKPPSPRPHPPPTARRRPLGCLLKARSPLTSPLMGRDIRQANCSNQGGSSGSMTLRVAAASSISMSERLAMQQWSTRSARRWTPLPYCSVFWMMESRSGRRTGRSCSTCIDVKEEGGGAWWSRGEEAWRQVGISERGRAGMEVRGVQDKPQEGPAPRCRRQRGKGSEQPHALQHSNRGEMRHSMSRGSRSGGLEGTCRHLGWCSSAAY